MEGVSKVSKFKQVYSGHTGAPLWTDTTENITFPKTTCAGGNNYSRGISFTKVKDTKRTLMRILSARGSRKLPNAEI